MPRLAHVRAEDVGSTPLFPQTRSLWPETGSNVKTYRKKNEADHKTFAGHPGVAGLLASGVLSLDQYRQPDRLKRPWANCAAPVPTPKDSATAAG